MGKRDRLPASTPDRRGSNGLRDIGARPEKMGPNEVAGQGPCNGRVGAEARGGGGAKEHNDANSARDGKRKGAK